MFLLALFVLSASSCFSEAVDFQRRPAGPLDDACIACICEGASDCNTTLGCVDGRCGPFQITQPYWVDAGKPVIYLDDSNTEGAWERCMKDLFCAAKTVQNYMARFQQDCNHDGVTDCVDYAGIHNLGGYGCNSGTPWNKEFESQFFQCWNIVKHLNG